MSTRFGIDLDQLQLAAAKVASLTEHFGGLEELGLFKIYEVPSELISVNSHNQQLQDMLHAENGILEILKWHMDESICVETCLRKAGADVCYVEQNLENVFRGSYDVIAGKIEHQSPLVRQETATGNGMRFRDGRIFPSFANTNAPLAPEPLGRDIEKLANQFGSLDPLFLVEIKSSWQKLEKVLAGIVKDVRSAAFQVQNSGTQDTFTYQAGLGIFRWADSISGLRHGVRAVIQKQERFVENFIDTSNELQEISAKRNAAAANPAFNEFSFPEGQFTARADQVLTTTYNPGLAAADTRAIEIAVPMRAVITEKVREPVIEVPKAVAPPRRTTPIQVNPSKVAPDTTVQTPPPPAGSQPGPGDIEAPQLKGPQTPAETKGASYTPAPSTTTPPPTGGNPQAPSWGGAPKAPPANTSSAGYVPYAYGQPYQMRGSRGEYINPRTKLPNSNIPLSFFQEQQRRRFDLDYWHQHPYYPGNNGVVGGKFRAENGNISGATRAAAQGTGNAPANNAGNGARGAMVPGGMAGAGGEKNNGTSRTRRTRRSAKNTNKILRFDDNGAIYGVIRHPSDPLFGTGR